EAHSLSDELATTERQNGTSNRIVNELDRQINSLSDQIDRTTVDLLLAQDALEEKRAVLERRLVDIYKRGPLYAYQVLLAAESFGDLLSRYKYLYLVSRQDRLLANDMFKLQRRSAPGARPRRAAPSRRQPRLPPQTWASSIGRWRARSCTSSAPPPGRTTPGSRGTASASPQRRGRRCGRSRAVPSASPAHSARISRRSCWTTGAATTRSTGT